MFRSLVSRETLPALWPVLAAGLSERQRLSSNATTTAAASLPDTPSLADFAPFSPIRVMRPNQNLEIAFDVRTRNPLYVLERLVVVDDNKPAAKNKSKRPNFYQDSQNLPAVYRSQNQHYHNSGYDRGHLAPAADFAHDASAYRDTFSFSNISPQDGALNKKTWARLEEWTRQVARQAWQKEQATTYVVTGPLWLPKRQIGPKAFQYAYTALGQPPSLVAVPSHFFKVIVVVKNDGILRFACFVMANVAPPPETRDLQHYLVRWGDLEATTGLQFFPNLVDEAWKQRANRLTATLLLPPSPSKTPLLLTSGGNTGNASSSSQ
jgi:DNA/RNA endonuclease G (NUC1)